MRIAALCTWIVAACLGGYLLTAWLGGGGLRRQAGERTSRFAPALIFGHGGLAATGLAVWIGYLAAGVTALAWAAVAVLLVVATLGATMFGLWVRGVHGRPRGRHAIGPRHAAEDSFPPPAVLSHGLFAVVTLALVLTTAVRAIH